PAGAEKGNRGSRGIMLGCADGEGGAGSIRAVVGAPKPKVASLHWLGPQKRPIFGDDRTGPATARPKRSFCTEYSGSCLLKSHIAAIAMMAAVCRSVP